MKRFLLFLFTLLLFSTGLIRISDLSNPLYDRVQVAQLVTNNTWSLFESRTQTCHYPADRLRAEGPDITRKAVP
jgi:hypothetical protein